MTDIRELLCDSLSAEMREMIHALRRTVAGYESALFDGEPPGDEYAGAAYRSAIGSPLSVRGDAKFWKELKGEPSRFVPFEVARAYVRSLGLKSEMEWREWRKNHRPDCIPSSPDQTYKDLGWGGFGDFLGNGRSPRGSKGFVPFKVARAYAQSLGLKSRSEWDKWSKSNRSDCIPGDPLKIYKGEGWAGWGNFLGTGNQSGSSGRREFLEFEVAKAYVRSLGLKTIKEYQDWTKEKQKKSFPIAPGVSYKDKGWKGWGDFLGTGKRKSDPKSFLSFEDARSHVRGLGLSGVRGYKAWIKRERPQNIPTAADSIYKKDWKGWKDFLGNE